MSAEEHTNDAQLHSGDDDSGTTMEDTTTYDDDDDDEEVGGIVDTVDHPPPEMAAAGHGANQPLIYLDDDTLKLNDHIEERIRTLQKTMVSLKRELSAEKELWRREMDEYTRSTQEYECDSTHGGHRHFRRFGCSGSICGSTLVESDSDTCCCIGGSEPTVSELTIIDYEKKLTQYQKALAAAQAEKRYQMRRHIAANTYKRRLLEVENMCNMELLRVKQSVQFLQPLQALASEWNMCQSTADAGDSIRLSLEDGDSSCTRPSSGHRILDRHYMLEGPPSPIMDLKTMSAVERGGCYVRPTRECIGSRMYAEMALRMSNTGPAIAMQEYDETLISGPSDN